MKSLLLNTQIPRHALILCLCGVAMSGLVACAEDNPELNAEVTTKEALLEEERGL